MKKFSISMLALAGLLFAACSEKDVIAEGGGGQDEVRTEGYMALAINLPTTPSTRAANDQFDDGDADEYKVTDCALLLFEGPNESEATLFKAQEITLPTVTEDKDNDNITTSYKATAIVNGRTKTGGNLYALALLNYKNIIASISDAGLPTFNVVDANGSTTTEEKGKTTTLAGIRSLITKANLITQNGSKTTKDYFFMTNAVLSTDQGGVVNTAPNGNNVFQLAELDPTKVFDTKEKAEANPAGEILVERAVAKATLEVATNFNTTIGSTELTINTIEWAIDNMEPKTYIARNPGENLSYISYKNAASSNYRFVGNVTTKNAVPSVGSDKDYYRTYWCTDPMYKDDAPVKGDKDGAVTDNYMLPYTSDIFGLLSESKQFVTVYPKPQTVTPLYCYENTFDVDHQSYKNTTRAIIKVTLTDTTTPFYSVNGGTKTDQTGAQNAIKTYIVSNTEVQNAVKSGLNDNKEYSITEETFNIEFESVSGQYKVKTLQIKNNVISSNSGAFKNDAESTINTALAALVDNINENVVAFEYTGGVMYYEARFQHFAGDGTNDLAPWNTTEYGTGTAPKGGSTANAYPGDETTKAANYLGRYGIVRNNWYAVEIEKITGLGYPTIPSVTVKTPGYDDPDTPDDNLKENIAVKIHVLSWAKRTQGWNF